MTEHQTEEFIGGASFSRLFEEMYDPALLFQVDTGTILFANSAARTLLEYDQSEITSVTASDIHPHEIPRFEAFVAAVLRNGRWSSSDLSCRTKSGHFVPADVHATALEENGVK